jgi:YD repeat-containing protein
MRPASRPGNRVGRIVKVTDASGSELRSYDKLGDLVEETKTVASKTQGNSDNSPEVWTTRYGRDRCARARFADPIRILVRMRSVARCVTSSTPSVTQRARRSCSPIRTTSGSRTASARPRAVRQRDFRQYLVVLDARIVDGDKRVVYPSVQAKLPPAGVRKNVGRTATWGAAWPSAAISRRALRSRPPSACTTSGSGALAADRHHRLVGDDDAVPPPAATPPGSAPVQPVEQVRRQAALVGSSRGAEGTPASSARPDRLRYEMESIPRRRPRRRSRPGRAGREGRRRSRCGQLSPCR